MPMILYYDPLPMADLSRLRGVAHALGAELRPVSRRELGQSLGFLAGVPGCGVRPVDSPVSAPEEPVMVLCHFLPPELDRALDTLREQGLSIPLKAVLTQTNRTWPMARLAAALQAERAAVTGRPAGS